MKKKAVLAAVMITLVLGCAGTTGAAVQNQQRQEEKIRAEVDGRRIFWDYGEEAIQLTSEDTLVISGFQELKKNGGLEAVCVYHFETGESIEVGSSWENVTYSPAEDGSYIPFLIFENGQVRMLFEYSTINGEVVSGGGQVRTI